MNAETINQMYTLEDFKSVHNVWLLGLNKVWLKCYRLCGLYVRSVRDEPESTTETERMIINNVYTLGGEKMHREYFELCDWWWIDCSNLRRGIHSQPPGWECDYFTDSSYEIKKCHFFRTVCIITVLMRRWCM